MNNKALGNIFERNFVKGLADSGFWVHRLAQTNVGQPADVIAVRNGQAYLIDCKVCSSRGFRLTRIEPNQETAMKLWQAKGNNDCWFALYIAKEVRMLRFTKAMLLKLGQSSLNADEIKSYTISLEDWLESA